MFKVNKKDTKTMSMTLFGRYSGVFLVSFENTALFLVFVIVWLFQETYFVKSAVIKEF